MMRQVIQQNPALLPTLLQEIDRENPELLQAKIQINVFVFNVAVGVATGYKSNLILLLG